MNSSKQENQTLLGKKVSRRNFLKAGAAGVAVIAGAQTASAGQSEGKRLAMVIDLQHCTGCGGCAVSCKSENNVQRGNRWAKVKTATKGKFPNVGYEALPTLCNHCEKAPCIRGCPTGAMHKGYGDITMHSPKKCIGCKTCVMVCNFEAVGMRYYPEYGEERSYVDTEKCMGCGSCVVNCTVGAQKMRMWQSDPNYIPEIETTVARFYEKT